MNGEKKEVIGETAPHTQAYCRSRTLKIMGNP